MVIKHIEQKTEKILKDLNIKDASQIDPLVIAKGLNIDVQPVPFATDITGLFVMKEDKPYIRYNELLQDTARRFVIAHELGHFILHKWVPLHIDKTEQLMFRNHSSIPNDIQREQEANAFAYNLIIPKVFLQNEIDKCQTNIDQIAYLANIFRVSQTVMCFRLAELDWDFGIFGTK